MACRWVRRAVSDLWSQRWRCGCNATKYDRCDMQGCFACAIAEKCDLFGLAGLLASMLLPLAPFGRRGVALGNDAPAPPSIVSGTHSLRDAIAETSATPRAEMPEHSPTTSGSVLIAQACAAPQRCIGEATERCGSIPHPLFHSRRGHRRRDAALPGHRQLPPRVLPRAEQGRTINDCGLGGGRFQLCDSRRVAIPRRSR